MILYDYICKRCNLEFEKLTAYEKRDEVLCKACGSRTTRKFPRTKEDWFRPFVTEDMHPDGKPIEVRTKEQYRRLCKEYDVYAPHAFGRGFNISEI